MRDVDSGLRVIPPKPIERIPGTDKFRRVTKDHLARKAYGNQARVADTRSKWSGYADPAKQAMADAGLIPQRPEIGEHVNRHGFVDSTRIPMDARHTGKDNGISRIAENVRCTSERYPTPVAIGSYWPRGMDEDGNMVVRPVYNVPQVWNYQRLDPSMRSRDNSTLDEFLRDLREIPTKGVMARTARTDKTKED